MAHLRVSSPGVPDECLLLTAERVVFGRSHECDLVLPDVQLSRRHAEIVRTTAGWELRDLASLNGTWLNGVRLRQPHTLRGGDVVSLADWQLVFHETAAPAGVRVIPGRSALLRDVTDLATRSDLDLSALARQSRVLAVLTRAADSLVSTPTLEALLDTLLQQLLEALPSRRAAVTLVDGASTALVIARTARGKEEATLDPALAERVREVRSAFLVPATAGGARSVLCAPLWSSGGSAEGDLVAGFVTLEARSPSSAFSPEDLQLVSAVANLASGRLDSLRLRQEAAAKRWLEEDVRGAARIQASLLPDENPSLEGWQIAGSTRLCSAVGADYYDFAVHPAGLLLALGDVAGKGLSAALLMAALRASVRALWREPGPVSEIMGRINHGLLDTVPENRYATLFLAQLDPATGRLVWVNAGHAPPLLVRRSGEHAPLEATGTILGPFPAAVWETAQSWVEPGDVLVLCSDGIFEAARAVSRPLTPGDLAEVVRAAKGNGASATLAALQAAADARLGGERQADDHTFVVLERLQPEPGRLPE